ncbi:MAG: PEP-CTERM sorting domain-containing protein [Acidobacteria bacterium]|nr:PEP-CTERM sorting domain-containing protein [Acidobacteriota bacterium]MBI3279243.1 PEP-CTERM sorting domain-containing protein [Acidobacteriota bacterium]
MRFFINGTAVPEPSSVILIVLPILTYLFLRRVRTKVAS